MPFPDSIESAGRRTPSPCVLLIGGEPEAAAAVRSLLEEEGYEVRHRFLAEEAIGVLSTWEPALVVVCLHVADMDGVDLCRRIREMYAYPILAVAPGSDERALVRALDEGADDVLSKPIRGEEFKARVRALLRRSRSAEIGASQIAIGELRIDGARRKVTLGNEPVALTRKEFDILLFLAARHGVVQPQENILDAVWGPHHGEYVQTLRVHIGHIRQKIERDPSRPRYVLTEPGIGYRFADSESDDFPSADQ